MNKFLFHFMTVTVVYCEQGMVFYGQSPDSFNDSYHSLM